MTGKLEVKLVGGIGNQLSCYFAGLYYAMEYNYSEITFNFGTANESHLFPKVLQSTIPKFVNYSGGKRLNTSIIDKPRNAKLIGKIRKLGETPYEMYKFFEGKFEDAPYMDLDSYQYHKLSDLNLTRLGIRYRRDLVLDGFFPTFRFFDEARKMVSGNDSLICFSESGYGSTNFYSLGKTKNMYQCTVHLRVGGYNTQEQEVNGVLSESYYLNAIEFVVNEYPGIEIKILSDNESLANRLYPNLIKLTHGFYNGLDTKSPLESFEIIRNSMVVIAANSGFSLWASKLSSVIKLTVMPHKMHKTVNGFHDTPESWVKIDNKFI